MKFLIINTHDIIGGAERNSFDLFSILSKKYKTFLVVGKKLSNLDNIISVKYFSFENIFFKIFRKKLGLTEIFYFTPFRVEILKYVFKSDFIHIHNIHGRYWSLFSVPIYSYFKKIIITLHDEFLISGDCAYTRNCNRWIHSCGKCPQLKFSEVDRYPATGIDNTRLNLLTKKLLFAITKKSNVIITAPSQLLLNKAKISHLRKFRIEKLNYGIDIDTWKIVVRISDKEKYFKNIKRYVTFIANNVSEERKGFKFLLNNYQVFHENNLHLLIVGRHDQLNLTSSDYPLFHFLGSISNKSSLVSVLSNSQCTLIPSIADNFPFVGLESLSCGTPILTSSECGLVDILNQKSFGSVVSISVFQSGSFISELMQIIAELENNPDNRIKNACFIQKNHSFRSMENKFLEICNTFRT